MKATIGAKIGAGYACAALALAIVGSVAYRNAASLEDSIYWVDHTHEVLIDLEQVASLLVDAETGQRGFLLTGIDRYLEPYDAALDRLLPLLDEMREDTADNPKQQGRLDALRPLVDAKLAELGETIELRRTSGFDASLQVVMSNDGKAIMENIRALLDDLKAEEVGLLALRAEQQADAISGTKVAVVVGSVLSLILITAVGVAITRSISVPLGALTRVTEAIAAGDLRVEIAANGRADEIGQLARATGTMVANLRQQIGSIVESANTLAAAISEILASTTQLAASATESATAVSETTTTVEEVRQTAQLSSQKAAEVAEGAGQVDASARAGRQAIDDIADGMSQIRTQTEAVAESIVSLSEQSQAIGDIVSTVDDLAEQSNLLAVNAAIEAARAGEEGKGFAVVAEEIKSLADQSKQATTRVRAILNDIQKATSAAVMAAERSGKAVEAGVRQSSGASEAIQALAASIAEAAQAAAQIAASGREQMAGVEQVLLAMENIQQASAQNAASTQQVETSATNLNEIGQGLKTVVAQYRLV